MLIPRQKKEPFARETDSGRPHLATAIPTVQDIYDITAISRRAAVRQILRGEAAYGGLPCATGIEAEE